MKLASRSLWARRQPQVRAKARVARRVAAVEAMRLFLGLSLLSFLLLAAVPVLAQAPPPPPPPVPEVPAGARATVEGLTTIPHYVPPRRDGDLPAIEVPAARSTVPPEADQLMLTPAQINIIGATALGDGEIAEMTSEFVGREVSLAELYGLAAEIQTTYRAQGYLLTRVLVPAQRIENGIFRIEVIEGFFEDVFVVGDIGPTKWQVEQYVNRLLRIAPVRTQDIERYLLLANDLPGIKAVAVIRPGTSGPGAAQLVVEVERDALDGYLSVNNHGSHYAGPWAGALSLGANGFAPYGDRTELIYYRTMDSREAVYDGGEQIVEPIPMEQWYGQISYQGQILGEGLRLLMTATQTLSHPGYSLAVLDIKTRSDRYAAEFSYPFLRTRARSIYGTVELSHSMVRSTVQSESIGRDRLTVINAGMNVDFEDVLPRWLLPFDFLGSAQSNVDVSIRHGLPWFGSSSDDQLGRSRLEGTSRFTSLQARVERTQGLFNRFDLFLAAKGQYSFDTLLSSEEFRAGGDEFGRGYDPSEIAGEHGYGFMAEFRYGDRPDWGWLKAYEAYAFLDYGVAYNEDIGFAPHRNLASTGFGVRSEVGDDAYIDLEYARPIASLDIGSRADQHRFLMRATVQF